MPLQPSWLSVCALAFSGIVTVAAMRAQRQTLREQGTLLSQAQKLLSAKDAMTFQALNLQAERSADEPDLGIIGPDDEFPPLSGPEAYFNGIDPLSAGALADAGIGLG